MASRIHAALLTTVLFLPPLAHSQEEAESEVETLSFEQVTIGVMDFKGIGVSQEEADIIADVISEHISRLGYVRVISKSDIQSMLNIEKQKRLAGCTDKECFSEIAGALDMPWMVTGNVSIIGESVIINLKLFNVRNAYVVGRSTRKVKGDLEDLLYELPDITQELFDRAAERLGISLPNRVTVASRHRQPIGESPSAVWVITRDDIEATGATTVPDLLRLVPGLDIMVAGPFFTAIAGRMYWNCENNHFLVLIDGREINFDPLGFVPWEHLPIFIEDIERIEVIRGPGSALYGANAMAGVVNITTRGVPDQTSARIRLDAGEAGRITPGVFASTRIGEWGISLGGGGDLSGTYTDPRDANKRLVRARALVERRWSESRRFLIDAAFTYGTGPMTSLMGTINCDFSPKILRVAYESEKLRGHVYWTNAYSRAQIDIPLEYAGVRLARFAPAPQTYNVVDGQVQWTLPEFFEPLLLLTGGGVRLSTVVSDDMLDAETYDDPTSPQYHQPGMSHWEVRVGAFVHAEFAPTDWVTVTAGSRVDYNTQTGFFVSPRLAAVFQPAAGQYVRVGTARSFRKPGFMETVSHLMVDFPADSPITGDGQVAFQEFMTRVGGNDALDNEELLAFEAGYLGRFMDGRLSVSLDLYYNLHYNNVMIDSRIVPDPRGLPDLNASSVMFANIGADLDIIGGELSVRVNPSRHLSLLCTWSHRQVYDRGLSGFSDMSPKNMLTLGGRFYTDSGLVGSLYAFSRSEFWDRYVENPAGLLEGPLQQHLDNVILLLGRIGWRFIVQERFRTEVGVKVFLPVSPFSAPHFRYYDVGGGKTSTGVKYGGAQLARMLIVYMQGSF
jgi:outer membrane receptor protein involved in Fe transport